MTRRGVLIVDDDPDFRLLVSLALHDHDDLVVTGEAPDAPSALRLTEELHPEVVLLDIGLPGPGPLALADEIHMRAPAAAVVLASARPEAALLGPQDRALQVVSKGLAPSRLAEEVMACAEAHDDEPPPATETVTASFPALLPSAADARRLVSTTLTAWGVEEDVVDTAVLLTSEVVTNALIHGGSGIEMVVSRAAGRIRVTVSDSDTGLIRRRRVRPTDQSGRGTDLVEALSDGWGICRLGQAKQVWFELRADGAG
jgi:DNA-binding NarL/FixJ family response regulator